VHDGANFLATFKGLQYPLLGNADLIASGRKLLNREVSKRDIALRL